MGESKPLGNNPKVKTHFWDVKPPTNKKDDPELGRPEGYLFLAMSVILMISATNVISSATDISNAKPCEMKTALDFLYLEYTPYPCKYHDIKEKAGRLMAVGIVDLVGNFILFLFTLRICLWQSKYKKLGYIIEYAVLLAFALTLSFASLAMFVEVSNMKAAQTYIDFVHLQSTMISWLVKHYSSDSLSSTDKISVGWNKFFLQYDCCAVRDVIGTSNDFDNTPWCTTSGSCQATASQIPKTCCKSVTKDDYQNAPSSCHASVNEGTFKTSCINRLKALSDVNIDECQLSNLLSSFLTLFVLQFLEAFMVLLLFALMFKHWRRANTKCNKEPKPK